jgi:hypothetical protein
MAQQLGLTESALLKRIVDLTLQGAGNACGASALTS